MKLRKGQPRYKMPPYSRVEHVRIEGNQRHNQMCAIMLPLVGIEHLNVKPLPNGRPRQCGVYGQFIEFEPPPDKPYEVKIRYTPPILEI